MRPFDRFLVILAAAFAMLAWLTVRRAAAASATPQHTHRPASERPVPGNAFALPGQALRAAHVPAQQHRSGRDAKRATGNRRIVRLGSGKRGGGNWPQPSWN
jgi:hypothetical protein